MEPETIGRLIIICATESPMYYFFWPVAAVISVAILRRI